MATKLTCYALMPSPPRIVPAESSRGWMDRFPDQHAYRCLPLAIANSYGWSILSPCSFLIDWTGGAKREAITFEALDDFPYLDDFVVSNFTRGIVTFHTGHLFRTAPGWNLFATGPLNNPKRDIVPLTGVIETDWLPYPFTMNWHLTQPGTVRFDRDEPFCTVFPIPANSLDEIEPEIRDLGSDPELVKQYEVWRDSRGEFLAKLDSDDPAALKEAWQKFYFKGEIPGVDGNIADHKHKLRLNNPVDKRFRSITEKEENLDFVYEECFLTESECDILADCFERNKHLALKDAPGNDLFDDRYLLFDTIPASERDAKRVMQQSRFRIIEMVARFFDEAAPLHSDTIQLVKWFEGQEHSAHADNAHPDGAPHNTPWRDYGSVVYLNDDYEGGEFFFQRSRLMIKPKKGMLLAFPGGHTHEHGVAKVRRGERYTMPGWYTRDSRHQDPSSLEVY